MASNKEHLGLVHIFTNNQKAGQVTLKAGSGETIKIKGDVEITGVLTPSGGIDGYLPSGTSSSDETFDRTLTGGASWNVTGADINYNPTNSFNINGDSDTDVNILGRNLNIAVAEIDLTGTLALTNVPSFDMANNNISSSHIASQPTDVITKAYADLFLPLTGGSLQSLNMTNHLITNVATPLTGSDAATKNYVDTLVPSTVPSTSQGDILYSSGTNIISALSKNSTASRYLSNTGTSNNPAWAQVDLTNGVSGILAGTNGGTGVNNSSKTITLGGNLTTSGAFNTTLTSTADTNVTLPTSGTLATTSQVPTPAALTKSDDTNVTLTLGGTPSTALLQASSITAGWNGTLSGARGGTGVNNSSKTIILGGNLTTSGAFNTTFTTTGTTNVTLPTSGTLATVGGLGSYLPLSGGTMSGDVDMASHNISNVASLTANGPTINLQSVTSNFNYQNTASAIYTTLSTAASSSSTTTWTSVCWSEYFSTFLAVGTNASPTQSNRMMTSSDGITWTSFSLPTNDVVTSLKSVCYAPLMYPSFIAVGWNTTTRNHAMLTWDTVNPVQWIATPADMGTCEGQINAICTGNNYALFCCKNVGVGAALNQYFNYSAGFIVGDYLDWSAINTEAGLKNWTCICFSDFLGRFVMGGTVINNNTLQRMVLTSGDWGTTFGTPGSEITLWDKTLAHYSAPFLDSTFVSVCSSSRVQLVVMVGKASVLTGGSQVPAIMRSADGFTWTSSTVPTVSGATTLTSVIWVEDLGVFICSSDNGHLLTSSDGITWTVSNSSAQTGIQSICYAPSLKRLICVGSSANVNYSTPSTTNNTDTTLGSFSTTMTLNGLLNPVKMRAYYYSAQIDALSTSVFTANQNLVYNGDIQTNMKASWHGPHYYTASARSTTGGKFCPPVSGFYYISAQFRYRIGGTTGSITTEITINGNTVTQTVGSISSAQNGGMPGCLQYFGYLSTSDVIYVANRADTGTPTVRISASNNGERLVILQIPWL